MNRDYKLYALLFALTILTAGGSILYLSHIAHTNDTKVAHEYPAPSTSVASDNATLTRNLAERGVFSLATTSPFTPDAWRTPGYPLFVLPFYAAFGSFYPVLIAQIFTLFLTVVFIFMIAVRLMPRPWAIALSVLYLFLPDTMLSASALLNENVFVLIFMAATYLLFFMEDKDLCVRAPIAGLLLALATYVRPASVYILVFFIPAYLLLYIPWRDLSRKHVIAAALIVLAFLLALLPWCIRNKQETGVFAFASTGPYVLFRQNAMQFYEAYNGIPNLEARAALERMAGIPYGAVPTDLKYSAIMQRTALAVIFSHPVSYAIFHLTTFIPFFTSSGAHDYWRFVNDMLPDFNPAPEPSLIQALHPFSLSRLATVLDNHGWFLLENLFWGVITLLLFLGLWFGRNVRLAWMFFAIIIYFAVVTGPIAHARYRIPVEPLIFFGAFSTAAYLYEHRKKGFFGKTRA